MPVGGPSGSEVNMTGNARAVLCAVMMLWLLGCSDDVGSGDAGRDAATADASGDAAAARVPGAEWETVSPEAAGMDPAGLEAAREYAFVEGRNTQGVVVVRGGRIVAEWYGPGADASTLATSWSVAKSFASTLIGIAIDRGEVPSVDVPMTDYIPEWKDTDKEGITLEHVLRMQTGIRWNENIDQKGIFINKTQYAFAIDREVDVPPMSGFNYSSADAMLFSRVIEEATGMGAAAYAQEHLFGPIGADAFWWPDTTGMTLTYCCLDMTTRDFARMGLMVLRDGAWGDTRVVSEAWLAEATSPADNEPTYGYQWWLNADGAQWPELPHSLIMGNGYNGQYLYIFPEQDLVVMRSSVYQSYGDEKVIDGVVRILTMPPDEWNAPKFLTPILEAIED